MWPHGLQHAKLPCPSPTPRACSNSRPSSMWCHQPSHPLWSPSPPAFSLSQHQSLFHWVTSSHQVAKILEFQLQHQSFQWIFRTDFLYDWLVSSCSPKDSQESSPTPHHSKASILWRSAFFMVQLLRPNITTRKAIALTRWTFVGKVMSLLLNMLSRLVITFLPKEQASFNFMAAVTICCDLELKKINLSLFPFFPHLFAMKWWDQMPFFECWVLSQLFHSPLSSSSRGCCLVPLHFLP